jgi:hypothetical protein
MVGKSYNSCGSPVMVTLRGSHWSCLIWWKCGVATSPLGRDKCRVPPTDHLFAFHKYFLQLFLTNTSYRSTRRIYDTNLLIIKGTSFQKWVLFQLSFLCSSPSSVSLAILSAWLRLVRDGSLSRKELTLI